MGEGEELAGDRSDHWVVVDEGVYEKKCLSERMKDRSLIQCLAGQD